MIFRRQGSTQTEQIPSGLRSHDPQAVADLYNLMGDKVYSVILAIVRNPITAEDLTQDTFVRVWNHSGQFTGGTDALGRWLISIGRHRAIDFLRQMRRRVEKDSVSMDIDGGQSGSGIDATHSIPGDPGDALSLRDAMMRLPQQQRVVIQLAYWEGLSQTEIAEQMAQPLGTVKGWTRSALKHLRNSMEEHPAARGGKDKAEERTGSFQ